VAYMWVHLVCYLKPGVTFHVPCFTLQFKKWSHFIHAEGTALPSLVDVEIRGIPVHAWERSAAEQMLSESCCVQELHPDTMAKQELSSFQLCAWSSALDRIHQLMVLVVPEQELPVAGVLMPK
jgi:hypothetical protein